ncbi:MAG: hypothetical protein A2Z38_12440 [Planctomycetes bacterium RBG_19FT_COMBO_48_8]|nr:MAG: hypothetical protein A2Z38_12440 [Planctomycetes bacterium RBG_19FT_COMBO_48_8]
MSQENAGNRQIFLIFVIFFLNNYEHMPIIYNMRNKLTKDDMPIAPEKTTPSGDEEISRP